MTNEIRKIKCPECGNIFDVEEALSREIEESYEKKLKEKAKELENKYDEKGKILAKKEEKIKELTEEREKQIEKVLINTTQFFGAVKGIAGKSIPEVKMLELSETV